MRRPRGRQRSLGKDRGALGKTEGNWGTERRPGRGQGASTEGTQRVQSKTPQN